MSKIEFWMLVWKICLVGTLVVFAGLAVWVTIGGARDIRKLVARLRDGDDKQE